jgi:hypothetical protein
MRLGRVFLVIGGLLPASMDRRDKPGGDGEGWAAPNGV